MTNVTPKRDENPLRCHVPSELTVTSMSPGNASQHLKTSSHARCILACASATHCLLITMACISSMRDRSIIVQNRLNDVDVPPIHLFANTDLRLIVRALCKGGKVEKEMCVVAPHCSQRSEGLVYNPCLLAWSSTKTTGPPEHSLQATEFCKASFNPSTSRVISLFPASIISFGLNQS